MASVGDMAEQILVQFEGEDSGVGELTWGQARMWSTMLHERSSKSIGGVMPLAPGSTVDDVIADLRFVMGRHSSLRTRLLFGADGHPRQVLAKSGEVTLEVIDAGGGEPAEIAATVYRRYDQKVFDYANEWPIRWAVIVSRGAATHLVSVICHLASDAMGVIAMLDDLASRDPATGLATGPASAMQPLEQVRQQRTPAARRQSEAALRHWERLLANIPARRFADAADKRQPRYWQAYYDSPASHLAIQVIAARTRTNTSTVLLAVFAVSLARVTGRNPDMIQVVVNNRFRPGFATTVSPICHSGLSVIDVACITFDEAVARAYRSAMRAYKLAYYDPAQLAKLLTRLGRERGEEIDISCFVNDRRMQSRQEPTSQLPSAAQLRAALRRSTLTWGYQMDRPSEKCFLHINNVPGTVCYELRADTHALSPGDMEACLRGLEAVAVEAALNVAAPTGILPPLGCA
jgi:hypothetical protein